MRINRRIRFCQSCCPTMPRKLKTRTSTIRQRSTDRRKVASLARRSHTLFVIIVALASVLTYMTARMLRHERKSVQLFMRVADRSLLLENVKPRQVFSKLETGFKNLYSINNQYQHTVKNKDSVLSPRVSELKDEISAVTANPAESLCKSSPPYLMILVFSEENMPSLRELIRNTWCKKQSYSGNRNLLCLFVVGRTSSDFSSDMLKEAKKYGDIKLTPFVEDVGNSSLKLIAAFKWIKTNCPDVKYVMRTQDDVIVNMDKLMNSLLISAPSSGFMMGKCREEIPNRNPYSRYYVPLDIYPGEKYPPVCSNMGYIMSVDVVNMIYQESSKQVMIPLDDVFIGVIMESRKMIPQSMDKLIHTKSISPTARTRYKICSHFIIHIHVNTEESAREIWQVMRDKCNGS